MTLQSYANLTSEQRIFYDSLLLDRALPALVFNRAAVKRNITANMGDRINFRRFELVNAAPSSITALTEGTAGARSTPSISNVTATISQYGRFWEVTDLLEDAAMDQVMSEYTEAIGEQAGIDIDTVIRDVITAGTTVQFASSAASRGNVGSGMLLNSAEIREIVRTMRNNNVKPVEDGKYLAFVSANSLADLLNDTDAKNAFQYAAQRGDSNPLFTGQVGDYLGLRFIESSRATVSSSLGLSGADVYQMVVVGDQAYAVSELDGQTLRTYYQPRGSGGARGDPLYQVSSLGYKCAFACTILNQNFLLRLEHVTTAKQAA